MAARAMWKAAIRIGDVSVPVKLYAAVRDRDVHFRLLHGADLAPVKQAMVHPETEEIVAADAIRRGYFTPEKDLVVFEDQELDVLEPPASRDIRLLHFLPTGLIDHRWYRRPYYLGPDGSDGKYAALARALAESGREGLARWVMRKKAYAGTLRLHEGYLVLVALRHADEVVSLEGLKAPSGDKLDARELSMARQLIEMLAADFEPEEYHDEYRERVMKLIETKASGGKVRAFRPRRKAATDDLRKALEASLKRERKHA